MFLRTTVNLDETENARRVLVFVLIDFRLMIDADRDEYRESKRHKWRTRAQWHRLGRGYENTIKSPRPIPQEAIEQALQKARNTIKYVEGCDARRSSD